MRKVWSEAELQFIKANAAIMKDTDIAARLSQLVGRPITLFSVRHARQRLGIAKRMGRGLCEVNRRPLRGSCVFLHIAGDGTPNA